MNNFKECREMKNLTVEEVSEKLGVTNTAIYNIEHGKNMPSVSLLLKFAKLYEVSTDYLLSNVNYKTFSELYEYLQLLDGDVLFDELDTLHINRWTTKDGKIYSKIDDGWFITIKGN